MDSSNARYIVMLIDSKYKDHEGKVFMDLREARQMVQDVLDEGYADKAAIGMFLQDPTAMEMYISHVETVGFKSDKLKIDQLELFKPIGV